LHSQASPAPARPNAEENAARNLAFLLALPGHPTATLVLLVGPLLAATLILLAGFLLAALVLLIVPLAAALLLLARAWVARLLVGILSGIARIGHSGLLEGLGLYPGTRGKRPEMKRVRGSSKELCDTFP
jgi:hypothetical protein